MVDVLSWLFHQLVCIAVVVVYPHAILICHTLFRAVDGTYRCKWHVPVDSLEVLEPDYQNDIWDYFVDSESGYTYMYVYGQQFTYHCNLDNFSFLCCTCVSSPCKQFT